MANSGHTPAPIHISERSPDKGSTQSGQSSSRELKINDNFWAQQLTSSYTQDSEISYQRLYETTAPFRSSLRTIKQTSYASLPAVVILETMMVVREIFADVIVQHLNPRPIRDH